MQKTIEVESSVTDYETITVCNECEQELEQIDYGMYTEKFLDKVNVNDEISLEKMRDRVMDSHMNIVGPDGDMHKVVPAKVLEEEVDRVVENLREEGLRPDTIADYCWECASELGITVYEGVNIGRKIREDMGEKISIPDKVAHRYKDGFKTAQFLFVWGVVTSYAVISNQDFDILGFGNAVFDALVITLFVHYAFMTLSHIWLKWKTHEGVGER